MHHTITYHLIQARMADLRHHARRDTLARAARSRGQRRRDGRRARRHTRSLSQYKVQCQHEN